MNLVDRWRQSHMYVLFNLKDDLAVGRCSLILHSAFGSVITWLTSGLFYTSFLMANDIDLVNINIISFIPFIAGCFVIFSPGLLERFQKRKWLLASGRLISYLLQLLGITVLPLFVTDPQIKIIFFIGMVFISGVIDYLITGGFTIWHLRFMPENVRADFLSVSQFVTNLLGLGAALLSGIVADVLSGSPYEDTIIVVFRYVAFAFGLLDVLVLIWPKEFPYERTNAKPKVSDIFVLPVRNRKFMFTIALLFLWTFFLNTPASTLNYYLLNDVGVSYSFVNIINMVYPLFLLFFLPFWKRILRTVGWWKTFAYSAILHVPTTIMLSCVTAGNYMWLYTALRLIQHFLGVGMNVAYANLVYLNLPDADQTNYISFYHFFTNMASFLGMMFGTWFSAAFPDVQILLLGLNFTNAQILQWVHAFGQLVVPVLALRFLSKINPDDVRKQFG